MQIVEQNKMDDEIDRKKKVRTDKKG